MWDLGSNQAIQVAAHDAPVKVVRWVKAPNYSALMSCSWDKTVKFWDPRYYLDIGVYTIRYVHIRLIFFVFLSVTGLFFSLSTLPSLSSISPLSSSLIKRRQQRRPLLAE
jgi:WD40 repeat protein